MAARYSLRHSYRFFSLHSSVVVLSIRLHSFYSFSHLLSLLLCPTYLSTFVFWHATYHTHFFHSALRSSHMALYIAFITLLLSVSSLNVHGFLFHPKILSPSSDVHIDIKNYVSDALGQHAHEFHHSWRDYLLVFLSALFVFLCCCCCCVAFLGYDYRRMTLHSRRIKSDAPIQSVATITPFSCHMS